MIARLVVVLSLATILGAFMYIFGSAATMLFLDALLLIWVGTGLVAWALIIWQLSIFVLNKD